MGKKLGAVLVGLGVLLLTMGLLSKFYAYSRLAVAPANQNSVTLAIAKDATYFSIADRAEKTGDLLTTVNTVGDVNASKQIS
ncbi:MAG TPA: porin PorA family protein, partial [Marmoricola sp.]|nr:porin PorA family protein [Marmoricola sp.]